MLNRLRYLLLGSPLPTQQQGQERLNKIRALAVFSPDALSSIAYANQEIYLGLAAAGAAGLAYSLPIGYVITGLVLVVALSYYQTIQGYPSGGGSYVVARVNLGTFPGLVAGAGLLVNYVLLAAVSLTASVEAIASAFPDLLPYRVTVALAILLVITVINLRGVRESGTLISLPVYLFVLAYLGMLAYGALQTLGGRLPAAEATALVPLEPVTLALVLHAFATGTTALTGVETISNGVPAFQPPESRNAGRTLIVMAVLMAILFLGSLVLTDHLGVTAGPGETILSALARTILGSGVAYVIIQISTMLILAVAANTSFAGFPRVTAILAQDGYLPRQLTGLGDRLVFRNGIVVLMVSSGLLIVLFQGDTHLLVPLFAVGAFLAFTLSQAGMVVHWWRQRQRGWQLAAAVNALGASATGITLVIVTVGKFAEGAWISILLIPLLVLAFYRIREHYREVAAELSLAGIPPSLRPYPPPRIVIPVAGVHRGTIEAIRFARSISDHVTGVYVELDPAATARMQARWREWFPDVPLDIVPSPYRAVIGPLLAELDALDERANDGQPAAVVLPEFVPAKWWHGLLHNQTAWLLKAALLYGRRYHGMRRVIIDVPFRLRR